MSNDDDGYTEEELALARACLNAASEALHDLQNKNDRAAVTKAIIEAFRAVDEEENKSEHYVDTPSIVATAIWWKLAHGGDILPTEWDIHPYAKIAIPIVQFACALHALDAIATAKSMLTYFDDSWFASGDSEEALEMMKDVRKRGEI